MTFQFLKEKSLSTWRIQRKNPHGIFRKKEVCMTKKKTVLIDLDGVLNNYNGNFDEEFIPEIRNGAKEFLQSLYQNYTIKLFTTRNRLLTAKWLTQNNIDKYIQDITNVKEPAFLYIDDRCVCFDGDFANTFNQIQNFKPWYK